MGKIELIGLEFFAYHGFYTHEREHGNRFGVDLCVWVDFEKAAVEDKLSETVSYEDLFRVVEEEMRKTSHLLEHLAKTILDRILTEYSGVKKARATIKKFNPPIGGVAQWASVTLTQKR